jgi:aryl-phospho-beta-D-glucosidase BglC (GH1 family)
MLSLFLSAALCDWYSTSGSKIIDGTGKTVRLTGLNWFGFETTNEVFHGLWAVNLKTTMDEVAKRGFNCYRVPVSATVLAAWKAGAPNKAWGNNPMANPELEGKSNLDVFDSFLAECKKHNQKVYIDVHGVTDGSYMDPLWYTAAHPPEFIITGLEWFAERYKSDDTVVGIDIKNEPHGRCEQAEAAKWDNTANQNNWKHFIETAAARILKINPKLLILVEGIECYNNIWGWWGGNLVPVKDFPINLGSYQKQLVYAPHEYGPSVSQQKWFYAGFSYDTLYKDHWKEQWMYIIEGNIAPICIGEWGGHLQGDNATWMKAVVQLIGKYGLSQTFWCLNPNSGDTGGLLTYDWKTWDEAKYAVLKPILAL